MEDDKKKASSEFELVEVTTQTAEAIRDPDGNIMTQSQALVYLLNEVKNINKRLG